MYKYKIYPIVAVCPFSNASKGVSVLLLTCMIWSKSWGQTPLITDGSNIVPNPGFERYASPPIGWSYKGAYFGQVVKYWFSATTASPDIYGPDIKVPNDWAEKGFGKQKARSGKSLAGLTLYGCINGKPHCREYIEIQLAEPLVVGQTYLVEFWTTPLERSLRIDNLGAYFSVEKIQRQTDEVLIRTAQVQAKAPIEVREGEWVKVSGTFQAKYEGEYLLIGNFNDDLKTQNRTPEGVAAFNYAYYYIDDVLVKKIPPFVSVPVKKDDLTRVPLEVGKAIRLKSLYFEYDRYELMPRSFIELGKLLTILREHPTMQIAVIGHTDNRGSDAYNLELSQRRAKAVADFLLENKIVANRVQFRGEGEGTPMVSNATDEGREMNRRVEFVVVKE